MYFRHLDNVAVDAWATAVEADNSRLRDQLTQVTKLIEEAIQLCQVCGGAEESACMLCQRFRDWLEGQ